VGNGPLIRVQASTAAEICARCNLNGQALALLRPGMAPREFAEALMAGRQYVDGIGFMAHALAAREGIWWGSLCLQHTGGGNLTGAEKAALSAAVSWVLWPTEPNRAAAQSWAQAAGPASAAGALAIAANHGGGGGSGLTFSQAVTNAVKISAIKGNPARIADTQRLFVELGIGVAEGRFSWPGDRLVQAKEAGK